MLCGVDAARLGSALRTIRLRLGLRQVDVARRAGLSQTIVSRVERGMAASVRVSTMLTVAEALEASVDLGLRWRGGELSRVLNAGHAAMHEAAAQLFRGHPAWVLAPEVTFSIYGERGAIDLLAFHPESRTLLVVELKTQLVDVQGLIGAVDRYRRLAPRVAASREWQPVATGALVLMRDTSTNRRAVAAHATVLRASFPYDGRAMSRWLKHPSGPFSGLAFLSDSHLRTVSAKHAGVRRVRQQSASVRGRRETGQQRESVG
jgi:transcriptional regulator with XRE-family HTH domain